MRSNSARAASLWLLIAGIPALAQLSTPSPGSAPESITSEALLQRAHAMLPSLSPSDRRSLLSDLADNTGQGKQHLGDAAGWVDEELVAASQAPDRRTRINYQLHALYGLSQIDSRAALDKLQAIEPPLHRGDDDPREGAATWAFSRFYQDHPDETEKIIAVTRHLSDTGTFPFGGVGNVLTQMSVADRSLRPASKEHREAASILVQEGVRYFQASNSPGFVNQEFTYFIRGYSQFVPPEMLKAALQELVARLLQPPQHKVVAMIVDRHDGPPIISHNLNNVLLAQLMPLVRSIDPAWAQELRQSPEVNLVTEELEKGSPPNILFNHSTGDSDTMAIQGLQVQCAEMLATFGQPERALKVLDQVSDSVKYASTAAELALVIKDSRPQNSAELLAHAQQTLEKTKAPRDRIAILYRLVHTLTFMKRSEQLAVALDQSFAAADEMMADFAARHHDSASSGSGAPYQLPLIVRDSARLIPEHTLTMINNVRMPVLQAHLLVAMAKGLDSKQRR